MPVRAETYERLALEDSDTKWELHCGRLVEKPPMTFRHNQAARELAFQLNLQIDRRTYVVLHDDARVVRMGGSYFIPDVAVAPMALTRRFEEDPSALEGYVDPLPLVVEVWSPSTGDYDVETKLSEYQARGDLEIWRLHPYERTLTAWRRQPDGSYSEMVHRGGTVQPAALPGVSIDLDTVFG